MGLNTQYLGESSRPLYERSLEHFNDYRDKKTDSLMYTLKYKDHPESKEHVRNIFRFKII